MCLVTGPTVTDHVKVHVTFPEPHDQPVGGEYMWAKPTDVPNQYMIDNIPFFADYGLGDVVVTIETADYDHEILTVVQPSGNLTARLLFEAPLPVDVRKEIAESLRSHEGVTLEWADDRYLAVSIPPNRTVENTLGPYVENGSAICDLLCEEDA